MGMPNIYKRNILIHTFRTEEPKKTNKVGVADDFDTAVISENNILAEYYKEIYRNTDILGFRSLRTIRPITEKNNRLL